MRALYILLPEPARAALLELALSEYRHPRDQAAVLVIDGLRQAGLLTEGSQREDQQKVSHAATD